MADVITHMADGIATVGWVYFVAYVNAMWQMEWPLGSVYFNLSSEVLNRTSFYMCGRGYLPMFLLWDGLLTLIYKGQILPPITEYMAVIENVCRRIERKSENHH